MKYNVFGSKSSQDRDVLIYINEIPDLETCKNLCKQYNIEISKKYSDQKVVNSSLLMVA